MSDNIKTKKNVFPFTAIIGQEEMKLALQLNIIDPKIGGVMIMGDRGTGKTTTVRALADLLPRIQIIQDDPYNRGLEELNIESEQKIEIESIQVPMIDLPLGATEDRVCGTIDIERALTDGVKAFEPGLLAKANKGILYVDEVNLLDDHLVDILLDSAASGWNTVEREGISIKHPAQFVLVGSGNPEEGELRPQLLDRFGMHAQIKTVKDPELRVKIVEERTSFDKDPKAWTEKYQYEQEDLKKALLRAQALLPEVEIPYDIRVKISKVCSLLDVDGLRGDIVSNRAAKAFTALKNQKVVTSEDVGAVITLCLRHRLRKDPLQNVDSGSKVKKVFEEIFNIDT